MESLAEFGRRVRFWLHRSEANRELEEEMRFHLQMKARKYEEAGLSNREAPFAAQRQFGNPLLLKELSSDAWGWRWLETFLQDVRFAGRTMLKSKAFTAIAIVTLALGIGVNAIMFSLVDGAWMRPLPVRDPGGLVYLNATDSKGGSAAISTPTIWTFVLRRTPFPTCWSRTTGGQRSRRRLEPADANGGDQPELFHDAGRWGGDRADVQRTLETGRRGAGHGGELQPLAAPLPRRSGRDRPGRAHVGYGLHHHRCRGQEFPGHAAGRRRGPVDSNALVERVFTRRFGGPGFHDYPAMVRLRPGATLEQARAEVRLIANRLATTYPNADAGRGAVLQTQFESKVEGEHYTPVLLLGIVIVVLLIACANIANLLLARGEARTREIGMRLALGCGRMRLVRQLLTESLVLGVAGAAAGLALAAGGIRLLPALLAAGAEPVQAQFLLDARVLSFTLVVSLLTVLTFGLVPAIRLSRLAPNRAVKDGASHARGSVLRGTGTLVAAQVALSVILLMSAGLLVRTLVEAMHADLGFERKDVLLLEMVPPGNHERAMRFYNGLIERLHTLPGVRRACVALRPPMADYGGGFVTAVAIPGYPVAPGAPPVEMHQTMVGTDYFELLGIRLLRGRSFNAGDTPQSHRVVIVNESFAQRYFAGQDPVGHVIRIGQGDKAYDSEIVGVARNVRVNSIQERPEPYLFQSYSQAANWTEATFMLETSGDPMYYANAARAAGLALSPEVDIAPPTTLDRIVQYRLQDSRIFATSVGILALLGLILASIGLYGVMSYAVAQRTREIGIRMALGARVTETIGMILWRGLALVAIGAAVGVAGALASTRLLSHLLYNVSPRDPTTLAAVIAVMTTVCLLASYIPARRAARVDPMVALRED